jgi:predicted membrane protein (TIGR00267 family)
MEEATKNRVNPIHYRAARFVVMYVALIDGLSPALTASIALSPFILASIKIITVSNAYTISLALSMATLFLLGIYLGKIAKENGWIYGVAMIAVGALTALTIFLIQRFLGA